jgi:hypothetical protein
LNKLPSQSDSGQLDLLASAPKDEQWANIVLNSL